MNNNQLSARLGWLVPAITITLSCTIHALSGNARAIPFFISESDFPGLERWVFTIGLSITGLILIWTSWNVFVQHKNNARWYWLHLSMLCGMWVGGNLFVMSFMNMYDHLDLHIVTALNVFHFGLAWGVLTHIALKNGSKIGKKIRYYSVTLSFLAFWIMSWAMGLAYDENKEALLEGDLTAVQGWIDYAAPAEFLLAIGFFMTIASMEFDMQNDEEE
ncbi:MAG: hypothetical protein QGI21_06555 [Candidatus Poseidoniaceae archaeon]|jgi:hypothetical protein|nr:hypothetical protein [Candidatus Poseidoniaceae archaeon]